MDILILLIPVALGLGLLGLAAFMWALQAGQFDDPEGAANRILFDGDMDKTDKTEKNSVLSPEFLLSGHDNSSNS